MRVLVTKAVKSGIGVSLNVLLVVEVESKSQKIIFLFTGFIGILCWSFVKKILGFGVFKVY